MDPSKSLILILIKNLASTLVVYLIDHSTGQYFKNLEQSQERRAVKTTKVVKTIKVIKSVAKARK